MDGFFSKFPLLGLVFLADFLGDFLLGITIESVKSPPSSLSLSVSGGRGLEGDFVTVTFSIISFSFFVGGVEVDCVCVYMNTYVCVCMCVCVCACVRVCVYVCM